MNNVVIDWLCNDGVIDAYFLAKFLIVMFVFDTIGSIVRSLMKGVYGK